MQEAQVCPYFHRDEEVCDVGCGYISSHDASVISRFCSCHYCECPRFRELAERGGPGRDLPTLGAHPPVRPAAPPAFGLFCHGLALAAYALDRLPGFPDNLHLLAIVLMLGAAGQISTGLGGLKDTPLRAIAFTGGGLFWLSILALDILPRAGYGTLPGTVAMTGYFAMWGAFTVIVCQGSAQLTGLCRNAFAVTATFLLLLAAARATASPALDCAAAIVGLAGSLPGILLGLLRVGSELRRQLHVTPSRSGKIRP